MIELTDINKVLIIRCGAIGDVLHTSEVFRSMKRAKSDIEIHYLTTAVPAKMLSADKDIDKIITTDKVDYRHVFELAKVLKKENYDVIFNLQPSLKLRLLTFLTGAKHVYNYDKNPDIHAVRNFFDTAGGNIKGLEFKNDLSLNIPENVIDDVRNKLPSDKKFIVVTTQAGPVREGKKWRVEKFKDLILKILNKYDVNIILSGTKDELASLSVFENIHPNVYIYAGCFDILESAAMFSMAEYVIGADTGPLHIASATHHPVCIALYGAMAIYRTGLLGENNYSVKSSKLGCIPCRKKFCKLRNGEFSPCMDDILPEDILEIIGNSEILPLKQV